MRSAEMLFRQLIEQTEYLLQVIHTVKQTTDLTEFEDRLDDRQLTVMQLQEVLSQESDPGKYTQLYQNWQDKEDVLVSTTQSLLLELGDKLKEAQHIRSGSNQYDSYFRQAPNSAFFDKKR